MNAFHIGLIEYLRSVCGDSGSIRIDLGGFTWDAITVQHGNDVYEIRVEKVTKDGEKK